MNFLLLLRKNKKSGYFFALLLMTLPSAGLYGAVNNGSGWWIWIDISLIIIGNLIALLLK
jgi:hypothetical protein